MKGMTLLNKKFLIRTSPNTWPLRSDFFDKYKELVEEYPFIKDSHSSVGIFEPWVDLWYIAACDLCLNNNLPWIKWDSFVQVSQAMLGPKMGCYGRNPMLYKEAVGVKNFLEKLFPEKEFSKNVLREIENLKNISVEGA